MENRKQIKKKSTGKTLAMAIIFIGLVTALFCSCPTPGMEGGSGGDDPDDPVVPSNTNLDISNI
ncbi:MAG: hypothetical protein EHM28_10590 [Spirochaetaceae bacterium]|nr:MAG: hypothetical protein EHM28_10590 [Spirochaetaceae bacterium]